MVGYGNLCLADEGREYLIYSRLQHCRIRLPAKQRYSVQMINPRSGEISNLPDADSDADNNAWQYRQNLEGDWCVCFEKKMKREANAVDLRFFLPQISQITRLK